MADRTDPFDLNRFVDAQARVYATVVEELRAGRKRSHWIWFIFPQLSGLGSSTMADRYGISSLAEARAYLAHPVLGPRLHECAGLVNRVPGGSIEEIFGWPDNLKVRSSMTLFARAGAGDAGDARDRRDFTELLDRYYGGEEDPATVARLTAAG